jgi:hypothetical protein
VILEIQIDILKADFLEPMQLQQKTFVEIFPLDFGWSLWVKLRNFQEDTATGA